MKSPANEYFKAAMTIIWQAKHNGKTHTRRIDLGHVLPSSDFAGLAVLNIGNRGRVISHSVAAA